MKWWTKWDKKGGKEKWPIPCWACCNWWLTLKRSLFWSLKLISCLEIRWLSDVLYFAVFIESRQNVSYHMVTCWIVTYCWFEKISSISYRSVKNLYWENLSFLSYKANFDFVWQVVDPLTTFNEFLVRHILITQHWIKSTKLSSSCCTPWPEHMMHYIVRPNHQTNIEQG